MDADLERTIIHYYPRRVLQTPLDNDAINWDYDPSFKQLKTILSELKTIDPELRPGTRGRYDISEELVVFKTVRLQLSYLGPYGALNHGLARELDEDEREIVRRVKKVLDKHGVRILNDGELSDRVPWIQHGSATIWDCLFLLPHE
jgi:hypothetical protein